MAEMTWQGIPLTEYSKPELIEIIKAIATAFERECELHRHTLDIWLTLKEAEHGQTRR
jgi:hypothetical protein